jgi:hypothetical protein
MTDSTLARNRKRPKHQVMFRRMELKIPSFKYGTTRVTLSESKKR